VQFRVAWQGAVYLSSTFLAQGQNAALVLDGGERCAGGVTPGTAMPPESNRDPHGQGNDL